MITKNYQPNAVQKRFHGELIDMGCVISGAPAELDHLAGAAARHDKMHIGQWLVSPLSPHWHRLGPVNRTSRAREMQALFCSNIGKELRKGLQYEIHCWTVEAYVHHYRKPLPYGMDVMTAILGWVRS